MPKHQLSSGARPVLQRVRAGLSAAVLSMVGRLSALPWIRNCAGPAKVPGPECARIWNDAHVRACLRAQLEMIQIRERMTLIETSIETMIELRRRCMERESTQAFNADADSVH